MIEIYTDSVKSVLIAGVWYPVDDNRIYDDDGFTFVSEIDHHREECHNVKMRVIYFHSNDRSLNVPLSSIQAIEDVNYSMDDDEEELQQILDDTMTGHCAYEPCMGGTTCIPCALDRITKWHKNQVEQLTDSKNAGWAIAKARYVRMQEYTAKIKELKSIVNDLRNQVEFGK